MAPVCANTLTVFRICRIEPDLSMRSQAKTQIRGRESRKHGNFSFRMQRDLLYVFHCRHNATGHLQGPGVQVPLLGGSKAWRRYLSS